MTADMVEKTLKNGEKQAYWRFKVKIYSVTHLANIVQHMNHTYGHGRTNWSMSKGLRKHGETASRRFAEPQTKTMCVNSNLVENMGESYTLGIFLTLLPEA